MLKGPIGTGDQQNEDVTSSLNNLYGNLYYNSEFYETPINFSENY